MSASDSAAQTRRRLRGKAHGEPAQVRRPRGAGSTAGGGGQERRRRRRRLADVPPGRPALRVPPTGTGRRPVVGRIPGHDRSARWRASTRGVSSGDDSSNGPRSARRAADRGLGCGATPLGRIAGQEHSAPPTVRHGSRRRGGHLPGHRGHGDQRRHHGPGSGLREHTLLRIPAASALAQADGAAVRHRRPA